MGHPIENVPYKATKEFDVQQIEDIFNPLGIKLYEVEEEDDEQANDR